MATYNKAKRLPPLNTLRLIPANTDLPAKYNIWPFDQGFFYQHIRPYFQTPTNYNQKLLTTDEVTIYIDTLAPNLTILILDEDSNTVGTLAASVTGTRYPNNNDSYFNQQYTTFVNIFSFADTGLPPGFYYIAMLEIYGGDDDAPLSNTMIISECIQVMDAGWDKTVLIEYLNSENDYDILFQTGYADPEAVPAVKFSPFSFRVEGEIDIDPAGHTIAFEDMFYQTQKLQDVPYRMGTFTLGDEYGVPAWVRDKVNRILACDMFMIDGVVWQKETNASWSWKNADGYPMKVGTIMLRDNPDVSEWEFNNSSDPDIPTIHDTTFDEMHD